ncbi:MAG: bifunctional phosphoribosylaminoimidazolecarboxamide formyltransferase/IMP cyclohydrolase [Longispora sp.]|nr:bifunctional phosphoribosylaminoimidazolecarboxamide formyltransferase/IMP cyclohydrolase [Longispora sp. (in: high G+C Gram-positive bacteria)]
MRRPIRRALISVYDKTGLTELAQALSSAGVEIVSTGSTANTVENGGVKVTRVEELTGFPECLDGRVKTLHPKVHAGLLADLRLSTHESQLAELGIEPFDLLVSNLYPFEQTVAADSSVDECVEQIDIGGPAMVRSSAKNHANVAVITSPDMYPALIEAVLTGGFTMAERRQLAVEAFQHTASYDVAVASWMSGITTPDTFPTWLGRTWQRSIALRYGENPHQQAALYVDGTGGLAAAQQVHGKEMSYNNYVDTDAAWRAANDHPEPCVAIIKHANPCGIAIAGTIADAHAKAHECDPVSAFGGVIAANRPVTVAMATQVADVFTEVIVAPGFEPEALDILRAKKSIRLLVINGSDERSLELRPISGGILAQSPDQMDTPGDTPDGWTLAAGAPADPATLADLAFAWRAVRAVKSNAILLAKGTATVGVGMGQVNRVDSARLAVTRAGERAFGSVVASDAFFPFADGLEVLTEAGITAVVQPGGSVRDAEVMAAAEQTGITLYLTGTRHFFH